MLQLGVARCAHLHNTGCSGSNFTHKHHRRPLRDHERKHHVAHLALPQGIHTSITGLPFMPTVPAEVVIGPIAVLLTVRIIVLAIVGHQVIQGEAIVSNDEVDALVGFPACMLLKLRPMLLPFCRAGISPCCAMCSMGGRLQCEYSALIRALLVHPLGALHSINCKSVTCDMKEL